MSEPIDPELVAELAAMIDALLPRLGRVAWIPSAVADRRTPWLGDGLAWPDCPRCGQAMAFFAQLDLATLPAELAWPHPRGLIQLFYCTSVRGDHPGSLDICEVECEAWAPFARSVVARYVAAVADGTSIGGQRIVGWEPRPPELPSDLEEPWGLVDGYDDVQYDLHDVMRAREVDPRTGDKLGGWPAWVQSPERPRCPRCRTTMDVLLQLDSNGLCGHQFGDLGAGHISQCRAHEDVVAFAWACH